MAELKDEDYIQAHLTNLAKRLRQLRKDAGYSNYEQFAYKNNFATSQYSRYERGEDLRLSTLFRVLKALDISPKDFFSEGFD